MSKQTNTNTDHGLTEITLESLYDVPVDVSIVLGKTSMRLNKLLKLSKGAIIELDRMVNDEIDIYVNNKMIAKGEIVIIEEKVGVKLTEIITNDIKV